MLALASPVSHKFICAISLDYYCATLFAKIRECSVESDDHNLWHFKLHLLVWIQLLLRTKKGHIILRI